MKTTWYVKYEIINKPGIKTFDTLEDATLFARKIMKKHSEIPKYIGDVSKGNRKALQERYRVRIYRGFLQPLLRAC